MPLFLSPLNGSVRRVVPFAIVLLFVLTAFAAVSFKSLVAFTGANGASPQFGLTQGTDGNFYGTTPAGGSHSGGTVYKLTAAGVQTVIYNFCAQTNCTDGSKPTAGLTLGTDGNFYGTTSQGGSTGAGLGTGFGTAFKITKTGALTTLYSFCTGDCSDGNDPLGNLTLGNDGNFYGACAGGGNADGTIFKISPGGAFKVLHAFSIGSDGKTPNGSLALGTDGNFYGTTRFGTSNNHGSFFRITPAGTLTTLYKFCAVTNCTDGEGPNVGVIQATDGFYYGTTNQGGANDQGTVFKTNSAGKLTTIHSFDPSTEGIQPGSIMQATDGNLYGGLEEGGTIGYGIVFSMTTAGALTVLHNFDGTDGSAPVIAPLQSTGGAFFGVTDIGGMGTADEGSLYRLGNGLAPFVETIPVSGPVGGSVTILGGGLTGATSVTFNGTPATFTVTSSSQIKATVPTGATTGKVVVVTPTATLTSNVNFRPR